MLLGNKNITATSIVIQIYTYIIVDNKMIFYQIKDKASLVPV